MSEWSSLLERWRRGQLGRAELLQNVDRLLAQVRDPQALRRALLDEHAIQPLPAADLQMLDERLSAASDKTLLRVAPLNEDRTLVVHEESDATELLGAGTARERHQRVEVNSVLLGRFKLVQLVGEGGMSRVYKAVDLRRVEAGAHDPYLAVKVLTFNFSDYFSSMTVLNREANKLQTLTHPGIVRVIDCDRDGQTVFMTMEFLDGVSLKSTLHKRGADGLPREEAVRIISSIASALDFAHRKHIVHGDLKPGNVIVTAAGDVKVIDFGIARFLKRPQDEPAGAAPEEWKEFSGLTPPYASPEMMEGLEPDARDDVYALACIAYEVFTGLHPFSRAPATTARDSGMRVAPSRQLRAREYRAIVNALAFEREQRTRSPQAFIDEFIGSDSRATRRTLLWVTAAVAVIALVGVLFMRARAPQPPLVEAAMLVPGSVFRDCPTCPLMRVQAAGSFEQGSALQPFEQPIHAVQIGYPLAAAVNEVTVGEFAEFARENERDAAGCNTYDGSWALHPGVSWRNAIDQQTSGHAVSCVSWQDAVDYAAWLSARTQQSYRLPSASEWEYLARAGADTTLSPDSAAACELANVADRSAAQRYPGWSTFDCADGYAQTAPVGSFEANAFGLHDLLGNVFEWVQDCWRDDYATAPTNGSAVVAENCPEREARGASWFTNPAFVRASYRNRYAADYRSSSLGFRLVREIKQEPR